MIALSGPIGLIRDSVITYERVSLSTHLAWRCTSDGIVGMKTGDAPSVHPHVLGDSATCDDCGSTSSQSTATSSEPTAGAAHIMFWEQGKGSIAGI